MRHGQFRNRGLIDVGKKEHKRTWKKAEEHLLETIKRRTCHKEARRTGTD